MAGGRGAEGSVDNVYISLLLGLISSAPFDPCQGQGEGAILSQLHMGDISNLGKNIQNELHDDAFVERLWRQQPMKFDRANTLD